MISDNILTHRATYYLSTGVDRNGKQTYQLLEMAKVRITVDLGAGQKTEGVNTSDKMRLYVGGGSVIQTKDGDEISLELFKPTLNDKLSFLGREFFVEAVTPAYDRFGLHHYEVGLR